MTTATIKRVPVLMGGVSLEHEVSLSSGQGVIQALNASRYNPEPVTILKDGRWRFGSDAPVTIIDALQRLNSLNAACIFLALHGPNGEDGRIQGMLDFLGCPYTGSGCAASALAIDKPRAKAVVAEAGVRVPEQFSVHHEDWARNHAHVINRILDEMGLPVVIKAPCQGSSCGMAISHTEHDLVRDMNEVMPLEDRVMVESFIKGLEVTCSVLDTMRDGAPRALPVTEIRPIESAFFDYYAKYTPGATQEITPARIGESLADKVREYAVAAHIALGCRGWSRSDFIIDEGGPVWLELNTAPGLTETSLFPQAAAAVGISYNELIVLLVEDAIERHAAAEHRKS